MKPLATVPPEQESWSSTIVFLVENAFGIMVIGARKCLQERLNVLRFKHGDFYMSVHVIAFIK